MEAYLRAIAFPEQFNPGASPGRGIRGNSAPIYETKTMRYIPNWLEMKQAKSLQESEQNEEILSQLDHYGCVYGWEKSKLNKACHWDDWEFKESVNRAIQGQ